MKSMIILLAAIIVIIAVILCKAINDMSEGFENLVRCHNNLCEITRAICNSLKRAGIDAPEERNYK